MSDPITLTAGGHRVSRSIELGYQDEKAAQEVVRNILALRKLTRDTKTQTSRAQGEILQKLPMALLTRVARILAELPDAGERRGAFGIVPSVAEEGEMKEKKCPQNSNK